MRDKERHILQTIKLIKVWFPEDSWKFKKEEALRKIITDPILEEMWKNRVLFGPRESDGPFDLKDVGYCISEVYLAEDGELYVDIDILDTPIGRCFMGGLPNCYVSELSKQVYKDLIYDCYY